MKSDIFTDIYTVVEMTPTNGIICTPREFGRAYGAESCGFSRPVLSGWIEFTNRGYVRTNPSALGWGGLIQIPNQFAIQQDVWVNGARVPGTLRYIPNVSGDAGSIIRIFGTDTNGNRIFDASGNLGLNLTVGTDTTQVFLTVDGLQFPVNGTTGYPTMVGGGTLSKVISTVATQIGQYEPGETRPQYTHYLVGQVPSSPTWRLYCKRKHILIPSTNPTAFVYPDNVRALEKAFLACTYADRGNFKEENEAWADARRILKAEYDSVVPPPEIYMSSDDFGASADAYARDGSWGVWG